MKCNVPQQHGSQKPSKIGLIKNKKKIHRIGELGMLFDKLEAQYNQTTDESKRSELKAKMDEIAKQIETMSNEVKADCYKKSAEKATNKEEASPSFDDGENEVIKAG